MAGPSSGSSGASLSDPSSKSFPRRQRRGAGCPARRRPPASLGDPAFRDSGFLLSGEAPWSCALLQVELVRHVCVGSSRRCFGQARRNHLPLLARAQRSTGPLGDLPGNGIQRLLISQLAGFLKWKTKIQSVFLSVKGLCHQEREQSQ